MPEGLFALNDRSISRAFDFPVVPGPAVIDGKVGAMGLHCWGGLQDDCRLLGLHSALLPPAPWCETPKAPGALEPRYPFGGPRVSSLSHLLLSKETRELCILIGGNTSILGHIDSLVRQVMKIIQRSVCCCLAPCGVQAELLFSIYDAIV